MLEHEYLYRLTKCPFCEGTKELTIRQAWLLERELDQDLANIRKEPHWWKDTVERLVNLELEVRRGNLSLVGILVRAAGLTVGFDETAFTGRLALISLTECVLRERDRQAQEDPEIAELLRDEGVGHGGGMFIVGGNETLEEFIRRCYGIKDFSEEDIQWEDESSENDDNETLDKFLERFNGQDQSTDE